MAQSKIIQVFLNADMRNGHIGMSKLAKEYKLDTKKLENGQFLVFINSARNKMKVYAASNIVAYMRLETGRLDLGAVRFIPAAFNGSGKIDYDQALKMNVEKAMAEKVKANSPLQVYRAMKSSGLV